MTQQLINIAMTLTLAVVTSTGWASNDTAEDAHHHPSHSPDEHTTTQIAPIPDTLWETDAPLREGMQRINSEVEQLWLTYQQHSLKLDVANTLAESIEYNVAFMINNCKLDPEADAALHGLLTELITGAAEIKVAPQSTKGMPRIVHALKEYPRYFLHPDWKPIQDKQ